MITFQVFLSLFSGCFSFAVCCWGFRGGQSSVIPELIFSDGCLSCSFFYHLIEVCVDPGVLVFADGGVSSHEGLFENNQLMRRENSQAAIQRAQAAATRARTLAMWPRLHHPQCPTTTTFHHPSSPCWSQQLVVVFDCWPAVISHLTAGVSSSCTCFHSVYLIRKPLIQDQLSETQLLIQKCIHAFSRKHWSGAFQIQILQFFKCLKLDNWLQISLFPFHQSLKNFYLATV